MEQTSVESLFPFVKENAVRAYGETNRWSSRETRIVLYDDGKLFLILGILKKMFALIKALIRSKELLSFKFLTL